MKREVLIITATRLMDDSFTPHSPAEQEELRQLLKEKVFTNCELTIEYRLDEREVLPSPTGEYRG